LLFVVCSNKQLTINNIKRINKMEAVKYTKTEASTWLEKVVVSAIANWENKNGGVVDADDHGLFIKTAFVDGGTQLKRFRPAPHGRAHRIRKRTNHVTIIVENRVPTSMDEAGETAGDEEE